MREFKQFCKKCKLVRDIVKVTIDHTGESVELSCHHKDINVMVSEIVNASESVRSKHKNSKNKLLGKYKTEAAGDAGFPARKTILIDREKQVKTHIVEEQFPNGEWKVVHHEETPFSEQKKKQE